METEVGPTHRLSRRGLLAGAGALGAYALIGCSAEEGRRTAAGENAVAPSSAARRAAMVVYREPSCGCCEAWARMARAHGYAAELVDRTDIAALKQRLGVPAPLTSCHTAVVSSLVVEGHVPLEHVDRLLRDRPTGILGIAVPGMPRGSPGMEMPDGARDDFQVIAFGASGRRFVFA
ncbi:DUF411 domain-containing protein [Sphingosinicella sp. LHD-64]|uniref:DUF411 domain-containing protein n=1 Tax=Sphingosinicella sp. LHD-64 TaxID=3072139 RepID=UPI0028105361|nr:DUF411 domain-containing protein [Sphingosinicella sp. LHD-64]MDQ8757378.1 DUF411 domain-containing protein [Sphingosinicella sp. LHD-64]